VEEKNPMANVSFAVHEVTGIRDGRRTAKVTVKRKENIDAKPVSSDNAAGKGTRAYEIAP
jgi:hypothetical protein